MLMTSRNPYANDVISPQHAREMKDESDLDHETVRVAYRISTILRTTIIIGFTPARTPEASAGSRIA